MKTKGDYIFPVIPAPVRIPEPPLRWSIKEGDALSCLRSYFPDETVRCWLTSPPYFSKIDYRCEGQTGLEKTVDEYLEYQRNVAKEMLRASTPDANLFWIIQDSYNGSGGFGGDYRNPDGSYSPHLVRGAHQKGIPKKAQLLVPERTRIAIAEAGWIPILKIVWDKSDPRRGAQDRPSYSYEEILAFSRADNGLYEEIMLFSANPAHFWNRNAVLTPFSEHSVKELDQDYAGQARFNYANTGEEDPSEAKRRMIRSMKGREGAYLRAVWKIASGNQPVVTLPGDRIMKGIASFPILLADICIALGSDYGDTVADPYAGMGTTLLAALQAGRNASGIELNPDYVEAAKKRIQDAGF
jgi:DNA modification methylase